MRRALIASTILASVLMAGCTGKQDRKPAANVPAFRNTALSVQQRAEDIVRRLTPEEKASQLVNDARAIPRLGIPAYNWWSEALHGVARNGYATVFPEPIGLAATFDPASIKQMGGAIATEARVKFNQVEKAGGEHKIYQGLDFWSPNINIFRDPRWGRGQETYGEDPFLTGQMGVAFVTGMQGDNPDYFHTIATAKHYAVHSGPEATRHEVNVKVSQHDIEDTYLPAFRALVKTGKVQSLMCAYNAVNGQPACANDFLLHDVLKQRWGFNGYVVSDCDAIADIQRGHHYTKTLAEAAAASLKLGVDVDCTQFNHPKNEGEDYQPYLDAMKQGLVSQQVVDAALVRLFEARIRLGLFDPASKVPYAQVSDSALNSPAHVALARKLASESMVLLKNNGILPISNQVKTIAVVGPLADQVDVLLGNYNGEPVHPVTALDGIRAAFPNAKIIYEPGTNFLRTTVPVPASALSGPDGQPGLQGEYWDNGDFKGAPVVTRQDKEVKFNRDMKPVIKGETGSARWTGFITAPATGDYDIGLSGGNAKLWIDGKQVVAVTDSVKTPKTASVHMDAGKRYSIRVEQVTGKTPVIRLAWNRVVEQPLQRAVAAARKADMVIAVAGISSALEGEEMNVDVPGFSGGDRTNLKMPAQEEDLLKAVKATGKPLALVLMNGSALAVNWAAKNADAILDAWYPGEQGGTAIGQTLSGVNNPSGRLPVTFYTSVAQLPPFDDYSMKNRTYRYFTGKPLYPFGYGLSYTQFAYDKPVLSASTLQAGKPLGVDAVVRNTGKRAGDEIVQLYISFPKVPGAPIRALRGFTRVHLNPGESRKVHFDLTPRDLSSVTEAGKRVVAGGAYTLSVGGGQPGTDAPTASAAFTIDGTAPVAE
ncbi:glycoside hydrolase family 3 C-terminal domain-containing protein [Stakelama sediminis]|uniref:Beta-glucosidase n=1 Tax=Stakelama sediminis TaxID=463200 RepID=A0A840YYG2_9SPHN|nr:glycoside hydrolase family 3 C-terminal domain-containing protein [Stakelama sediminis]MBB5718562.1 beta-glucosidase [Stakelama sediminis]